MNEPIHNNSEVTVPAVVLQHPALNPAMVYTWMLLRMLVGDQDESGPIGIQKLVEYIGKSSSTLYEHLAALRLAELVRWKFEARGKMIFSFPKELFSEKLENDEVIDSRKLDNTPSPSPENWIEDGRDTEVDPETSAHSENLDRKSGVQSGNLENAPSFSPEIWNKNGHKGEKESDPGVNSEKLDDKLSPSPENWNDALSLKPLINNININYEEVLREARFQKIGQDSENLEREAVRDYRQTLGLRPNQAQRKAIGAQVRDLELWQATLEHWQMHRWNPKNIPGILELYARDGPEGCRFCRKKKPETGLEALEILRREYASGEYG